MMSSLEQKSLEKFLQQSQQQRDEANREADLEARQNNIRLAKSAAANEEMRQMRELAEDLGLIVREEQGMRRNSMKKAKGDLIREQLERMQAMASDNMQARREEQQARQQRISLAQIMAEEERARRMEEDEAIARALQFNFICESLDHELASRRVMAPPVRAASLAAAAQTLENQLLRDRLKHQLTFEKHQNPGNAPTLAAGLAGTAMQLERQLLRDRLGKRLGRRNSAPIIPTISAPLAGTAHQLNAKIQRDRFARDFARLLDPRFQTNQQQARLASLHHMPAPRLQAAAHQLEQQRQRDHIAEFMRRRFFNPYMIVVPTVE